ncbi:hypothetical protein QYM36_010170 [Artemia franciscana]|uniref:Uncharacterized protein n=1 Tax=Artemia franciscana TaxID=6661 RepID=A0AA88HSF6_ARTSF|nr:hypothetical protein QYM36_010170 [Artemia franciscana]
MIQLWVEKTDAAEKEKSSTEAIERLNEELRNSAMSHSGVAGQLQGQILVVPRKILVEPLDVARQLQDQILNLSMTVEEKEQALIQLWVENSSEFY